MFTLDTNKKHFLRAAAVTLIFSLACIIFTIIYYRHSHKVYSDWMTYMFLLPLCGGTVLYLFFALISSKIHRSRVAFNLYNSGIAALTVGFCSSGVFEISGGDSPYLPVFFVVGTALCAVAVVTFIVAQFSGQRQNLN